MDIELGFRLRQQMTITPRLQQAVRLLQMSSQEFAEEIEQALGSNPFLENGHEADDGGGVRAEGRGVGAEPTATPAPSDASDSSAESTAQADPGDDPENQAIHVAGFETFRTRSGSASDDDQDWTTWTAAPVGLAENLRQQLRVTPLGDRDRMLAHLLIDELSDAGYLETPLEEIAPLFDPADEVDVPELQAALHHVQSLEPVGIGARSVQECLQLQLAALPPDTPDLRLASFLLGEGFQMLARREFAQLQKRLGCDELALHRARALIRTLEPRPGHLLVPDDTRYVIPDVIVWANKGRWHARLNPAARPQVGINHAYARLAGARNGGNAELSQLLQEARWLLRNVEQRFSTIERVAKAIVARQQVFFRYGEAAMKPMALKDIADELGLHESTVCRVTNGKYMATPGGLYEFKYFFSREMATADGGACSATAIRAVIRELVAAEDPASPASDVELTGLLADQGLRLARRTVTKYRNQLRIPSADLRRAVNSQSR